MTAAVGRRTTVAAKCCFRFCSTGGAGSRQRCSHKAPRPAIERARIISAEKHCPHVTPSTPWFNHVRTCYLCHGRFSHKNQETADGHLPYMAETPCVRYACSDIVHVRHPLLLPGQWRERGAPGHAHLGSRQHRVSAAVLPDPDGLRHEAEAGRAACCLPSRPPQPMLERTHAPLGPQERAGTVHVRRVPAGKPLLLAAAQPGTAEQRDAATSALTGRHWAYASRAHTSTPGRCGQPCWLRCRRHASNSGNTS